MNGLYHEHEQHSIHNDIMIIHVHESFEDNATINLSIKAMNNDDKISSNNNLLE
jgi:hypothetical protein